MSRKSILNYSIEEGCTLQNTLNTILPVLFFIIGIVFFKYVVFKEKTNEKEENRKRKISAFILDKYKDENEKFFFGNTTTTE